MEDSTRPLADLLHELRALRVELAKAREREATRGVAFESAALATMVPVGLMIVSPILAQEKTAVKLLSSEWSRQLWKGLYYALPKIFDIGRMTLDTIMERPHGGWMPVWSSAAFAVVVLALALALFRRRDF